MDILKEKRNFRLKMHKACGNDDLRPVMSYVCFDNGYMVATDAHLVVKAKVSEFSHFTPEEIELLNGKFLSSDTYKKILSCKSVVVEEEGVVDLKTKTVYKFQEIDGKYPNYNAVLDVPRAEIDGIGLTPKLAKRMFDILSGTDFQTCHLKFGGKNKGITISHPTLLESDFVALMMPAQIMS